MFCHGKCLNLINYDVYNLQQTNWFCNTCSANNNLKCYACNLKITITNEKFEICKNCFLPVHKMCSFRKICINCIPDFKPKNNPAPDINYIPNHQYTILDDDYFNNLPIFNPFDDMSTNHTEGLTTGDEVYEKLEINSQILNSCKYYSLQQFVEVIKPFVKFNAFSLIGLNIDGFKSNFDQFKIFNHELVKCNLKISCFCFCETNINEIDSGPFKMDGYNQFISDKFVKPTDNQYKQKGSGIAIYVDNKFHNCQKIPSLCVCTADIEILTVAFTTAMNFTYYIVGVYRTPSGNVNNSIDSFDLILSKLNSNHNNKIHVIGDFNFDLYHPERTHNNSYLDCVFSNGFNPLISRATHFQGVNPTCIDHILTNNVDDIRTTGIIPYNITHHMLIFSVFEFHDSKNPQPFIKFNLCINSDAISGFNKDFNEKIIETDVINHYTAKDSFHQFITIFKELYDKWFLHEKNKKCKHVHVKADWITPGLAKSSETKNLLYTKWRKEKTKNSWNTYVSYRRKYDIIRNKIKFEFYNQKFSDCKSDTKKVWSLINNMLGRKKRNSCIIFTSSDASHNFNKYFTSVAAKLVSENYPNYSNGDQSFRRYLNTVDISVDFNDCDFDIDDLNNFIDGLNNNKSTYYSPKVFKKVKNCVSPYLIKLFNKCYRDGYFPRELKTAKVIPIFKKKGEINSITNYRPISLLSIISKLFEKLIHKKLYTYFDDNDIINENQYGFRPSHSTSHAIINATKSLYKALDNDLHTLGIFIDFSKAFDTVDHVILCSKLENYSVKGNVLKLISNYLSGRD